MGTDMHVAIEIRRKEWDYVHDKVLPKWKFVRSWSVDRCYSLFGCFSDTRRDWKNSVQLPYATDMSYEMRDKAKEYYYGFYHIAPDVLKKVILGWHPSTEEWLEEEGDLNCRPVIDKEWFFDMYVNLDRGERDVDNLNYAIYKLMLRKYGKDNVRLIVYFDS